VLVRKDLSRRLFSLKGAVTMATVTMQSAMNPKHSTENFAGCIDPLPHRRLVAAPDFSAGYSWCLGRPPGL
jgi:hypothetical protein